MKFQQEFKILLLTFLSTSAFSDQSKVLEAFDAQTRASDTYYMELKKLDQPTPEQLEALRKKIRLR